MSPEVNADEVERRLARLREEWGVLPVEREDEVWAPDEFEESLALARSGYTGGGYVFVVRDPDQAAPLTESMPDHADRADSRVLLAMGRGVDRWGPPGGGREPGETYEETAVREVREETGIECSVTGTVAARRWTTTSPDHDERVHTLFVTFAGDYVGGHVQIQPGELNGAAWFREFPDNLHPFAEPFAAEWEP